MERKNDTSVFNGLVQANLGFSIASLSKHSKGLELLNHQLLDVRRGAISAYTNDISVENLKLLAKEYDDRMADFTHKSPRTIALYKAIDGLLEKMEVVSSEEEFDAISKLVKTLSNGDLIDRITWTLRGIKFRLSGAEST